MLRSILLSLRSFLPIFFLFLFFNNVTFAQDIDCSDCHEVEIKGVHLDAVECQDCHSDIVDEDHEDIDVAKHVDLLVGMVPIVNLEWIQKIHRDRSARGYSTEAVTDTILRRMPDYLDYICPQFTQTDINFQRVPTVDTSNPFSAKDIPTLDESFVVIRFRNLQGVDFPYLLQMIDGSFMSRINTFVVPGGKMGLAMELILTPLIEDILEAKRRSRIQMDWVQDQ